MCVEAVRRRIYKAPLHVLGRLVRVSVMVDVLVVVVDMVRVIMIVAIVMRVAVHLTWRGKLLRMRSMPVADYSIDIVRVACLASSMTVPERSKARHGSGEEEEHQTPHG
jgi:hypothetical protein